MNSYCGISLLAALLTYTFFAGFACCGLITGFQKRNGGESLTAEQRVFALAIAMVWPIVLVIGIWLERKNK
jgi:hypothetical protein